MTKVVAEKQVNNFVKGLVTEASPLTYPENASLDEENFDLERDGSRKRRLGVDYETGYQLNSTGFSDAQLQSSRYSSHKWDFPGGSSTVVLGVIRIINKLWFVNLLSPNPSANLKNGGLPITISGLSNAEIDVTVINNYFIIVSSDLDKPVLLSYNASTDVVSQETLSLKSRDIWGVYDSLAIDTRPATLSSAHKYNLRNQGWSTKITSTCGTDAIDCTFTTIGVYPSNADIWTLGKIGDASSANFEKYDPNSLKKNSIDNSLVSQGSYIIDIFNRGTDRISISGVTDLPTDAEQGNLTTIASYASRVFYSGILSSVSSGDTNSPNYSGYIFFTQIVTAKDKLSKCYQEADPTSPNISDIVDTDGGTIQIPEASKITKLIGTKSSLIVLAENGVWEIYGDTGGFVATSFQLSKITSAGTTNLNSIVEIDGNILYWANSGIYLLTQDSTTGRYVAKNVSISTIQSLYDEIPTLAKTNARGFYDERHQHVRWLYNIDDTYSETNYINNYNRELNFDLTLQAFYKYKIESLLTDSPKICGYLPIPDRASSVITDNVYEESSNVLSVADQVVINIDVSTSRTSDYNFLTLVGTSFTLSSYRNTSFVDWKTANGTGVNFSSYLLTGYELFGDMMRKKQVPYILFYFKRTEDGFSLSGADLIIDNPSSCLVQAQWNWTDSANSGKWGTQFQAYRFNRNYIPSGPSDTFDYGESVIITKNKLLGSGKCLSLKIQSEQGKDMHLLGWANEITGNSKV